MNESSDGQLVAEVLSGSRQRFAEIVRRYQQPMLRAAQTRLGRWDWAEEVVQETFLSAFKSLHTYNCEYSFRTWLWTILLNQCNRHYQKRQKRPQEPLVAELLEARACPDQPEPLRQVLARERDSILHELLSALPDVQADALRLRFFGGLKFREIADAMQCSLSSAKSRVRWGLSQLSQWMREQATQGRDPLSVAGDSALTKTNPNFPSEGSGDTT